MPELLTGTITFLFTDIEGSTRLLQELGDAYDEVNQAHAGILRAAIAEGEGREIRTEGDSFFAVFPSAPGAVSAAVVAQRSLAAHPWPHDAPLRVRMGLHSGEGRAGGDNYLGLDVNRAARIAAAAHGGQIVLSDATRALVESSLPDRVRIRDLGIHRLKDLARPERLFDLVIDGLPDEFPTLRSIDARPNNLPTQLTSFVGREKEIREALDLLESARLVTLTGPGGTGKTRLALQVAAEAMGRFPDGSFFVDLSPITDPALVPSAIAAALDVRDDGSRPVVDAVAGHLQDRELLLVLDNFEQVVDAAGAVETLLRAAPKVRVLGTSRVVLHLYGEHESTVPPLATPDPGDSPNLSALSQNESVALFVERARAVKSEFRLTGDNAATVAAICARLEGLPLAIELAASRVRVLSPRAILERLDRRLPLLASEARNLPARQRTLRGAIDWSHDLLAPPSRRLFARMSIFAGGCSFEAVEAICDPGDELGVDTLAGLSSLVDASLVEQREAPDGEARFAMLETIREYASERLSESDETGVIARRHAEWFLDLAEQAEPHLMAEDQLEWLDRCERESDNLRAALGWSERAPEPDTGLRIAAALWRFWQQRGHPTEGRAWLDRLLARADAAGGGTPSVAEARAHSAAGGLAYWQLDNEAMRHHYQAAVDIHQALGDRRALGRALYDLSFANLREDDLQGHERLLAESRDIADEVEDREGVLQATVAFGFVKLMRRDPEGALPLIEAAIDLSRELGNAFQLTDSLGVLGHAHLRLGNLERALAAFREALTRLRAAGNIPMSAYMLYSMAALENERGHHQRAMRLYGAGEHLRDIYATIAPVEELMLGDPVAAARAAVGDEATERALAEGRAMDQERAIDYALRDDEDTPGDSPTPPGP